MMYGIPGTPWLSPETPMSALPGPVGGVRHMLARRSPLPAMRKLPGSRHQVQAAGAVGAQHNPSVAVHEDRLLVCVRVLQNLRTVNWLGHIDEHWRIADASEVQFDGPPGLQMEDLRLFSMKGQLYASASFHQGTYTDIRQGVVVLDGPKVAAFTLQPSPRAEKNWMPSVLDDELRFVYSVEPLVVLRPGDDVPVKHANGYVRGSSQLVPYGEGRLLAVVHDVYQDQARIVYVHRFAVFDANLTTVAFGAPWYFDDMGIEFCAGAAWWQDRLVLSYGWKDRGARLASLDARQLAPLVPGG
jgi:hypothetical protein